MSVFIYTYIVYFCNCIAYDPNGFLSAKMNIIYLMTVGYTNDLKIDLKLT